MKKYTTLLFDNDDTIMDFAAAERQGIERTFLQNGVPFDEEILASYSAINLSLWKRLERGEIKQSDIYTERFHIFREKHGFDFSVEKASADYMVNLAYGHDCFPGAKELLCELRHDYKIYIITNGFRQIQEKRIKDAGLLPLLDGVFVSETTGYQKPHPGYFQYVFEHIEEKDKSRLLIIGDSLSSDIKGGTGAGIDTCWVNMRGADRGAFTPTYDIHSLNEIYSCL